MANDTRFGLAATLVTGDPRRAERVTHALNAGTVWVNCFFVRDLGAPFGGNGQSGIGREGGTLVLRLLLRDQEHRVRARTAGPARTRPGQRHEPWVK